MCGGDVGVADDELAVLISSVESKFWSASWPVGWGDNCCIYLTAVVGRVNSNW